MQEIPKSVIARLVRKVLPAGNSSVSMQEELMTVPGPWAV